MHISIANILQMMADRNSITIEIKLEVIYWLSIEIFIFGSEPF